MSIFTISATLFLMVYVVVVIFEWFTWLRSFYEQDPEAKDYKSECDHCEIEYRE